MAKHSNGSRISDKNEFLLVGGLILLAIHVYVYLRVRAATGNVWISALWLTWSAAAITLLFITRKTSRINAAVHRKWSDRLGTAWVYFAFYVFVTLVAMDLLRRLTGLGLPAGYDLLAAFAAAALILSFGVRQANIIQTIMLTVPTNKLEEGVRLRIVQLSDLHLGPFTGILLLAQILRRVREVNADMVVVTGDLADGVLKGRKREIAMLRRIKPRYGVFAVPGNHEYYDSINDAVNFMKAAGMTVLRGELAEAGGIIIAGADDRDHMEKSLWGLTKSEAMLLSIPREKREKFVLLLRHRPVVEMGTLGHFDLQLSGHTHGGQLLPTVSSRHIISGRSRGIKKLRGGSSLYISNGAGYVGPPVRFMAPPEIAVFDLVGENGKTGKEN